MPFTRAGVIALRRRRGRTLVLLVRASGSTQRVFPKGHIEQNETPEQAALRELREEAGIQGRLLKPAGDLSFEARGEQVGVHYFLALATGRISNGEDGRDPIWVDPRVALSLLAFDNARDLLRKNLPAIDRLTPPPADDSKEFHDLLLADFNHLGESLLHTEESGEKRVTFFITLATATLAALGYFGEKILPPYGPTWRRIAAGALGVLLLLGLQTMQRVVERNATSDGLKMRLNRIRRALAGPTLRHRAWLAFDSDQPPSRKVTRFPLTGSGGWLDTIELVNAAIVGGIVALVKHDTSFANRAQWGAGGLLIAWLALHWLGRVLQRRRWEKEALRL